MTPNQFQAASGRGTARDWKRSIKHHGTSLKSLITSHVLSVDPPKCRCAVCCAGVTSAINSFNAVPPPPPVCHFSLYLIRKIKTLRFGYLLHV